MPEAGYSGTPLAKKLGIKPGHRLAFLNVTDAVRDMLAPQLPGGMETATKLPKKASACDVILYFTDRRASLVKQLPHLKSCLCPAGRLWLCWPKRSSGLQTDLSENDVRNLGLAAGLVDNKVCAVDATWSGLRFVYRFVDRPPAGG